ncbi:MAG TPA: glycosyltransferase family 39 protein [Kiloniellales bacterium]|jgi:4-amino-4-deoxy-L-arabinose transferase-like glycosyltransferase
MTPANNVPDGPGGRIGSLILSRPAAVFWGFVGLHVAAWTLLPALADPNLPLDVIEILSWGHEWQFGYAKHPPLTPWLAELFAALGTLFGGGAAGWPLYLLSQVCVGVAFWAMWRLARDMLDPVPALLSVLLLEGIYYHNFTSPEFNANVVLLPFWALAILAFHRALRDGAWQAWAGWGLAAGLGLLGKYYTAVLLVPMAALMLATPAYRRQIMRPGPYVGLAVLAAVLLPHIGWLTGNDFPSFSYAVHRAGGGSRAWSDHVVYPLRFLVGQAPILLPALAILIALGRPRRDGGLSTEASRFLLFVGFGPLLVTMLLSAIAGFKVRSMWGTPLFLSSGLMLIGWFAPRITAHGLRRFAWAWSGIFALALAAYLGTVVLRPLFYDTGKRTHFPGRPLAAAVTAAWHERFGTPLPVVVGDPWPAGNVAFYSVDRPSVYLNADPLEAPWLSDAQVKTTGAVIVWLGRQDDAPATWRTRFGPWDEQAPLSLSWQIWGDLPPLTIGWAIVPPQ